MAAIRSNYGESSDIESFYFAVLESDRGAREIGNVFSQTMKNTDVSPLIENAIKLLGVANVTTEVLKEAFGLLIKAVEVVLLNNKDDLRFTNVLTFNKWDNYLVGRHEGRGDQ